MPGELQIGFDQATGGVLAHVGGRSLFEIAQPARLELVGAGLAEGVDGVAIGIAYTRIATAGDAIVGTALIEHEGAAFALRDEWRRTADHSWRIDRQLTVLRAAAGAAVRLLLELKPAFRRSGYADLHYFAPPALYDLNDLNRDGVEDYLESRRLSFRDDRLNARALLAFSEAEQCGIAIARADRPKFDEVPDRQLDQQAFLQATDIGSIGIAPGVTDDAPMTISAAYPFVERDRTNALYVKERKPWGAFWPATPGAVLTVSYELSVVEGIDRHAGLWAWWQRRLAELDPQPVVLGASLAEIARLRTETTLDYYMERAEPHFAAGFVTNCHPQDGRQLSNVVQYGFTGQNVLTALNLLRSGDIAGDRERKALRVIEFFVSTALQSPRGITPGLYNFDTGRFGSWWTGLLLPLAYASPGGDLEKLMGPVYQNLREVIEALSRKEGAYLRCMVEEYEPLLDAYLFEWGRGQEHASWRTACIAFAEFLADAQEADGSWRRAYGFDGSPMTEPESWFGQTAVQQKSSTATVVPFLLRIGELTTEARFTDAAIRAGRFVKREFVDPIKFNGGIHDSIYAKPQLVDGESIIFACKALLKLHQRDGDADFGEGARRGAQLVASWMCLWDVPLPSTSTLARYEFRSTGWAACDAPGAGYIHPMGLLAVPLLVEAGLAFQDTGMLRIAALVQAGCNETVALPGKSWGYAKPGLQEEGLLVSWWFADDPMFRNTGFGSRGKGEGNKTCLPWIAAVAIACQHEMLDRFGTTDIDMLVSKHIGLT